MEGFECHNLRLLFLLMAVVYIKEIVNLNPVFYCLKSITFFHGHLVYSDVEGFYFDS